MSTDLPSAQLFATLDPENGEDQPSRVERHLQWLESVRPGWAQEIRECMASGDDGRVCKRMTDRPTPLTDYVSRTAFPTSETPDYGGYIVMRYHAMDLERKLAEAREALESADRLIAACGYMPSDATRSKIAQAIARIDAKGKETA